MDRYVLQYPLCLLHLPLLPSSSEYLVFLTRPLIKKDFDLLTVLRGQ